MEKGRLERHSEEILRGGGMKERCIRCGKETEYNVSTRLTQFSSCTSEEINQLSNRIHVVFNTEKVLIFE